MPENVVEKRFQAFPSVVALVKLFSSSSVTEQIEYFVWVNICD